MAIGTPFPHRSNLRLFWGRWFYTQRQYLRWLTDPSPQARVRDAHPREWVIFRHASPLNRPFSNVDPRLVLGKITNLRLACEKLDGLVVAPGQSLSFWRRVGKPTRAQGYQDGMVLTNGQPGPGLGGGLCQLTNLLFWMSLHTPLTVLERWRHSYDVFPDAQRTLPFGSGATCIYNYRDLKIKNTSTQTLQLKVGVGDQELWGEWRSDHPSPLTYQVYEQRHWFSQGSDGRYLRNNILRRKIFQGENQVGDDYLTENHALMMYAPFLEGTGRSD